MGRDPGEDDPKPKSGNAARGQDTSPGIQRFPGKFNSACFFYQIGTMVTIPAVCSRSLASEANDQGRLEPMHWRKRYRMMPQRSQDKMFWVIIFVVLLLVILFLWNARHLIEGAP